MIRQTSCYIRGKATRGSVRRGSSRQRLYTFCCFISKSLRRGSAESLRYFFFLNAILTEVIFVISTHQGNVKIINVIPRCRWHIFSTVLLGTGIQEEFWYQKVVFFIDLYSKKKNSGKMRGCELLKIYRRSSYNSLNS